MNADINKPIQVSTEDFIRAFGYKDTDTVYYRCFYERPDKDERQEPPKNLQGKLSAYKSIQTPLDRDNAAGYGIFFVVNGDGQSDAEVKHARAQFIEIDDKPFTEQLDIIGKFPVEPSIIVKTRKSLHTYWILKDGDIKRFRGIQERLITYFNSDTSIKNASRVMRLPNFKHNKQEPVDVQVIKFDPALTYTQDEIEAVLPAIVPAATPKTHTEASASIADNVADAGGRHNYLMQVGGKLRHAGISDDEFIATMRGINNSFAEPLDDREIGRYITDLIKYKHDDEAIDADEDTIDTSDEAKAVYEAESAADLADLDALIEYTGNTPAISTGFLELDSIIDDGIRNGFYIIGAISSLGKTTFTLQICDNLAKQGIDVLFYSLEMSRAEMQAKSISRESLIISLERYKDSSAAKTSTGIMNGRRVKAYRDTDAETVQAAKEVYKGYAGHIHIIEGIGNIGVKDIEAGILKHKALTGKTPVVVIDYLQLLASYEAGRNLSDKQITDKNVLELKRLSRQLPIIAVSSFNRESYTDPISLSAFKESGAIEYTADILIGLQYFGMDYEPKEGEKERKQRVASLLREQKAKARDKQGQDIQVKIMKNRHGITGDIELKYYPAFNYYKDKNPFTDAAQV